MSIVHSGGFDLVDYVEAALRQDRRTN